MAANTFTVTIVQQNFTAELLPQPNFQVSLNGNNIGITPPAQVIVTATNTVQKVEIVDNGIISVLTPSVATIDTFSGDGVTRQFQLTLPTPNLSFTEVIVGGVVQTPNNSYTLTNTIIGSTGTSVVVFNTAPPASPPDNITIRYFSTRVVEQIPGPPGPQGLQGVQGLQGARGLQGLQGVQGLNGSYAAIGAQGLQGVQGLNGAYAALGAQGVQGVQGRQGVQGLNGSYAAIGAQGIQGTSIQGTTGAQGLQGPSGSGGGGGLNRTIQIVNSNTNVTLGNLNVKMQLTTSTVNTTYWAPYFSTNIGTYTVTAVQTGDISNSSVVINTTPHPLGYYDTSPVLPIGEIYMSSQPNDEGALMHISVVDLINSNVWDINVTGMITPSPSTLFSPKFVISIEKLI
jgi:hypothetical protein